MAKKKRMSIESLPYYGSKAQFENGDKVMLPNPFLPGIPCFFGVVVGKGKDEYGEYQEVKIASPNNRSGEIKKCRLMDLAWLTKVE